MGERLESLLDKDPETVYLDELVAARVCFEILGEWSLVREILANTREASDAIKPKPLARFIAQKESRNAE